MPGEYYCTQIDFGTPEFDEAVRLRNKVLRQPLNLEYLPQDLATEYDSLHLACYHVKSDDLAATLILKPLDKDTVKMRQVAVEPGLQSQGVGSLLVRHSETVARLKGFRKIELHARDTAVPFYKKLGYTVQGNVFKEVGIDHLYMEKEI